MRIHISTCKYNQSKFQGNHGLGFQQGCLEGLSVGCAGLPGDRRNYRLLALAATRGPSGLLGVFIIRYSRQLYDQRLFVAETTPVTHELLVQLSSLFIILVRCRHLFDGEPVFA